MNECEANGEYCSRNSVCKNRIGFYECEPCKNQFIGDGKICQSKLLTSYRVTILLILLELLTSYRVTILLLFIWGHLH